MDYILRGGIFIWPIVLESIIAVWIIVERLIFIFTVLPGMKSSLKAVVEIAGIRVDENAGSSGKEASEFAKAITKAKEQGVLNLALLRLQAEKLIDQVERNLSILNIVAQSAPLFGFLGTVTGMIQAFIRIQDLGGQVTPSDLAGGIWEALITTAAGLMVGIPALIAYIAFAKTVERFAIETDAAVSEIGHRMSRSGLEVI